MGKEEYLSLIQKGVSLLKNRFGTKAPDIAVILGSGLGTFSELLEDKKNIPYSEIPGFPTPKVPGHAGECVIGKLEEKTVLVFRGRFHFYEGHSLQINTLPVRISGAWGVRSLIVTNASGAIRKDLKPGLLLINDHLNLLGQNPLFGENLDPFGPRFFDMTTAYDKDYRTTAKSVARKLKIPLPEGIYAAVPGPSYETAAEIRMLATLGADVVGMSTVPEVIVARHHQMRVLGISCMTNYAAGVLGPSSSPITHEEVIENSKNVERDFKELLRGWIATYEDT